MVLLCYRFFQVLRLSTALQSQLPPASRLRSLAKSQNKEQALAWYAAQLMAYDERSLAGGCRRFGGSSHFNSEAAGVSRLTTVQTL